METALLPIDEPERLEAVRALDLLDKPTSPLFERFVQLAAHIMGTPIAAVSLIDARRQWIMAKVGIDAEETPREVAFCSHTILDDAPLVVEDARGDDRFCGNPYVVGEPNIRFYAGAPLVTRAGHRLGALCAVDMQPRRASTEQIVALRTLAAMVTAAMEQQSELEAANRLLAAARKSLHGKSQFLAGFSHELRTPLNHVIGFAEVIENGLAAGLPADKTRDYARLILQSGRQLHHVIDGITRLEKAAHGIDLALAPVDPDEVIGEVVRTFHRMIAERSQRLRWHPAGGAVCTLADETALRQIAINLISNASKHCPNGATIEVSIATDHGQASLAVADDGPGISVELLTRLDVPHGQQNWYPASAADGGVGLGLRISTQLAAAMGHRLTLSRRDSGGTLARLDMALVGAPALA